MTTDQSRLRIAVLDRIYPPGEARLRAVPPWFVASMLFANSRIAQFRDLLATEIAECRALIDAMVAKIPAATPPMTPDRLIAMRPAD